MDKQFFNKFNYILIGIGIVFLIIGYWSLSRAPVDGFLTMNFAPIVLCIAYCIIFPVAILWNKGAKSDE